jgi:hypothetical protein
MNTIVCFTAAAFVAGVVSVAPPVHAQSSNPATGPGSAAMQSGGYHGGPTYGYGLNSGADHLQPGPPVAPVAPSTTGSAVSGERRSITPGLNCATTDSYGRTTYGKC